ncbi:MAG: LTA synthase family protein [Bacteroidota bacterium]|nr:LTA synthase family protein [Bacteroidota bacterium]
MRDNKFWKRFWVNPLIISNANVMIAWRFLVVMLLFSVTRLLFYVFNRHLFVDMTPVHLGELMLQGLRFDLAGALYVNILNIALQSIPLRIRYHNIYQSVTKWIFFITNGVAIMVNLIDIAYFPFTLHRTDWSFFTEFGNNNNLLSILGAGCLQYWYLVFIFIFFMVVLVKSYGKSEPSKLTKKPVLFYPVTLAVLLLVIGLSIAGIRGGFTRTTRPITLADAGTKANNPAELGIVLNTPFSMLRTINAKVLEEKHYYSDSEVESIYSPIHKNLTDEKFQKKNVVILILESFARENVGSMNRHLENGTYKGYTPFLDSLISVSHSYFDAFANGRKSIEAMPSVLASVPSLYQPFAISRYASNHMKGLAALLKAEGYQTAFFHGAPNGSMGFDAMSRLLGYDAYYGMNEYGNNADFDGFWGIKDEEFLQYFANKMGSFRQPFLTTVFTLSSHHPFHVPEKYQHVFPEGKIPLHKCIRYSDYALRRFFKTASQQPWYKNTIFVITADHSLPAVVHNEYKNGLGDFAIPIVFFTPDHSLPPVQDTRVMQQLNVMPTLLDYLHYPKPYFAFGADMLDKNGAPFVVNDDGGVMQYMEGDYMLRFDGKNPIGLYRFREDVMLNNNLLNKEPGVASRMTIKIKAILQQYNNRLIRNQMVAR